MTAMYGRDGTLEERSEPCPEGSVHLWAKAPETRASFDRESGRSESTLNRADSTVRADTVLYGLVPGRWYFVRYRIVTKEGVGDWSPVLSRLFV
jgi:hypothetical protein